MPEEEEAEEEREEEEGEEGGMIGEREVCSVNSPTAGTSLVSGACRHVGVRFASFAGDRSLAFNW